MVPTSALDEVLSPEYVADVAGASAEDLRAKQQTCAEIETAVSYYRRLAQGRIEILEAWAARQGDGSVESLVAELPKILAAGSPRSTSVADVRHTDAAPAITDVDLGGREQLVRDETLANLPLLSADEIEGAVNDLRRFEQDLSETRRRLHEAIDVIEGEIAVRQASGSLG